MSNDAVTIDQQSFEITIRLSASPDKHIEAQVGLFEGQNLEKYRSKAYFLGVAMNVPQLGVISVSATCYAKRQQVITEFQTTN